jgi:hypothetical protein
VALTWTTMTPRGDDQARECTRAAMLAALERAREVGIIPAAPGLMRWPDGQGPGHHSGYAPGLLDHFWMVSGRLGRG